MVGSAATACDASTLAERCSSVPHRLASHGSHQKRLASDAQFVCAPHGSSTRKHDDQTSERRAEDRAGADRAVSDLLRVSLSGRRVGCRGVGCARSPLLQQSARDRGDVAAVSIIRLAERVWLARLCYQPRRWASPRVRVCARRIYWQDHLRRDTDENLHDAFTHSITVKTRKRMCRAPPPGKMHRRGVEHADEALVVGVS